MLQCLVMEYSSDNACLQHKIALSLPNFLADLAGEIERCIEHYRGNPDIFSIEEYAHAFAAEWLAEAYQERIFSKKMAKHFVLSLQTFIAQCRDRPVHDLNERLVPIEENLYQSFEDIVGGVKYSFKLLHLHAICRLQQKVGRREVMRGS